MVNRFLRTAPTRTLLSAITGVAVAIAACSAIAVAATSGGPVPPARPLASAVHGALTASPVQGLSADINFTNNLIGATELQGTDPLLQGGSGHLWVSDSGQMRLELYGSNGDPELVVNGQSWWISDPMLQTIYEGTLPAQPAEPKTSQKHMLPTVAQIQADINHLAQHLRLSGALPTDVGGQPTYTVSMSPRQAGGLIGKLQLAWDAVHGVPLRFAVYARHDSNPVLELAASNVTYGTVDSSVFSIQKPSGYHAVNVATPSSASSSQTPATRGKEGRHSDITGVSAVAKALKFKLSAPASLAGRKRQSVSLLGSGRRGALLIYGQGLGAIVVMEQPAGAGGASQIQLSSTQGDHQRGVILPSFSVRGATAQELNTALGTFARFTSGAVTYTVIGSVNSATARAAARGL